jgi:hypothetical protein
MSSDPQHPYASLEGTAVWRAVERAIDDLVKNQDLTEQTPRHYIVGYICRQVDNVVSKRPS